MGRRKDDNPIEAIFGIYKAAGILCGLAFKGIETIEKNKQKKSKKNAKLKRIQTCEQKAILNEQPKKQVKNIIPEVNSYKETNNYKNTEKPIGCLTVIRNFFAICCFVDAFVALTDEQMPAAMFFPFVIIGILLFTPTARKINLALENNPHKIAIKVCAIIIAFILAAALSPNS